MPTFAHVCYPCPYPGKLHSVLNDKDKRAVYDEEGVVDEEDDILTQNRDWDEYWRLLFKRVTLEDIKQFETEYKGSEEEEADLRTAYVESEGRLVEMEYAAPEVVLLVILSVCKP